MALASLAGEHAARGARPRTKRPARWKLRGECAICRAAESSDEKSRVSVDAYRLKTSSGEAHRCDKVR